MFNEENSSVLEKSKETHYKLRKLPRGRLNVGVCARMETMKQMCVRVFVADSVKYV